MIEIKTKLQKWGNSFRIVIPLGIAQQQEMKNGDEISVLLKKSQKGNVLREIFGSHKFSKPISQLLKEADKELYNE